MMKITVKILCLVMSLLLLFCGCKNKDDSVELKDITEDYVADLSVEADIDNMDFEFSNRDALDSYDTVSASILFSGGNAETNGGGTEFSNGNLTIFQEGTYVLSGSFSDGKIIVDASDTAKVQLVFDNLNIQNTSGNAIYLKNADKVFITLKDGTSNSVSDGASYVETDGDTTIDAALFSKTDLTINGTGALNINGNCKHAIISKDDLVIVNATVNAVSKNVALGGKDCVKIDGAKLNITAGTDAVRSDNTEDSERGFIYIKSADADIVSENDAFQAATVLKIESINLTAKTGGGSSNASSSSDGSFNQGWGFSRESNSSTDTESAKVLKAGNSVIISGGNFNIDCADDAIHSNKNIEISGGEFSVSSGDDGIHADDKLTISSANINITKSYEGIEATDIIISGGDITVTASDDGMNAAGGNDASAVGGRPGQNSFSASSGSILISGGNITVNASGDGIDSNGTLEISGGKTLVNGPSNSGNGALDYQSTAKITGGTFIAVGASGMAQSFSSAEQGCIFTTFNSQKAGSTLSVTDVSGNTICSINAEKSYNSVVVSSPEIAKGNTYNIVIDGETVTTVKLTSNLYGSSGMGGGMHGNNGFGGMRP